jgi:hypothetical protein
MLDMALLRPRAKKEDWVRRRVVSVMAVGVRSRVATSVVLVWTGMILVEGVKAYLEGRIAF